MTVTYDGLMSLKSDSDEFTYTDRDTMLYALGVGMSRDPMNEDELRYTYENDLKTVPTLASVIAWGQRTLGQSGINYLLVVHGEQRLTLHKPLPSSATIISEERVTGAVDKGAGKGALIFTEKVIRLKGSNEKLCTVGGTIFARGYGGFGGPSTGAPEPHAIPERKADGVCETDTRPDQALLYRLSGDRNPLHSDPKIAKMAGFPRPILHGLCSYGTACRAVLKTMCNYDHTMITGFDVRFSSPVFPGETLVTEMWKDGHIVSFRSKVKERDVVVINNGKCTLKH
ncbi:MAG: MaoC family dehydratase N-terminal domain-containing protein [Alphaproteobacteria bacterium]|nr:MaoC family dehydratase N-terminal domain-containing protein [Alphaproteobacteria bacterium]